MRKFGGILFLLDQFRIGSWRWYYLSSRGCILSNYDMGRRIKWVGAFPKGVSLK
jgi:hypothetical protein